MDKSLDTLYNIDLSEDDMGQLTEQNIEESKKITSKYDMDPVERNLCWIAGLAAGAMDFFLISKPKEGGFLNRKADSFMKGLVPKDQIRKLEKDNWVPYDAATLNHLKDKVLNPEILKNLSLRPKSHRIQSVGHDPILGFFYGVRDILQNTFTCFDSNGELITIIREGLPIETDIFSAISRQFGHLKSDISTSAGLPIPFMGLLQSVSSGDINGKSVAEVSQLMYAKGYNLNHLVGMSIPAITIEVIIRTFYCIYSLYKGESIVDSLPFNKPKVDKMLFNAYLISVGCNSVKIMSQSGNLFAINPVLWSGAMKYGIKEFKKYMTNEKERKRHKYVLELYEKQNAEWDELILKEVEEGYLSDKEKKLFALPQ